MIFERTKETPIIIINILGAVIEQELLIVYLSRGGLKSADGSNDKDMQRRILDALHKHLE